MRGMYAWCLGEGAPGLVNERSPLGAERATYGICPSHRLQVLIGHSLRTFALWSGPR